MHASVCAFAPNASGRSCRPAAIWFCTLFTSRSNVQVAQSSSREEPRDPPPAVPKVKGSRVGSIRARGDQDCEARPTIAEVSSEPAGLLTSPAP